jgi:hypothetical protein
MVRNAPLSPRLMMALIGPVIGVISGAVLGVFALVAVRLIRPRTVDAQPTA